MGRRAVPAGFVATVALALLFAPTAQATFHEVMVREVYPGGPMALATADYVELQMWSGGQNQVKGHEVRIFDAAGNELESASFPAVVSKGAGQSTLLLATPQAEVLFGVSADAAMPASLSPAGGAVCWEGIDCVSWGAFSKPSALPSPAGSPAAPGGIPDETALRRTIARGCTTALDTADDQNDSAADFSATAPAPRPNSVAPSEQTCGGTGTGPGGEGPKGNPPGAPQTTLRGRPAKRTRDRTPTFRFSADEAGTRFQCKLDGKPFRGCRSPFTTKKLSFGRHTFRVRAVDSGGLADPSPIVYPFKVLRPDT